VRFYSNIRPLSSLTNNEQPTTNSQSQQPFAIRHTVSFPFEAG
jgi:hypothetical protein